MKSNRQIHPQVRIGHIHLKVADADRVLAFTQRFGYRAAFVSAAGYHQSSEAAVAKNRRRGSEYVHARARSRRSFEDDGKPNRNKDAS